MDTQSISVTAASLSALAAALSAATAFRSYRLAKSIQEEARSDERILVGRPSHPRLNVRDHSDCVLQVPLFNKSKRKACVNELTAYDSRGRPIEVVWSDRIDSLGNPQEPGHLVGITDQVTLYVRRNDGARFEYARLLMAHSFSSSKEVIVFDEFASVS